MVQALKSILKTGITEMKRVLTWNKLSEHVFDVRQFGKTRFICSNRTEYYRTVEFGGESKSLASFLFLLEESDVVWDIGASVGLFSVHSALTVSKVVAFEPDPATFARLKQNIAINGFSTKVDSRQLALSSEKGTLSLQTDGLDGNAPSLANLGRHSKTVDVNVTTIDALINEGTPRPTVLKIDIEGAEILALRGAVSLLSSASKPRILFVEVHPLFLKNYNATADEVEEIISRSGYKIIGINRRDDQYQIIAFENN